MVTILLKVSGIANYLLRGLLFAAVVLWVWAPIAGAIWADLWRVVYLLPAALLATWFVYLIGGLLAVVIAWPFAGLVAWLVMEAGEEPNGG